VKLLAFDSSTQVLSVAVGCWHRDEGLLLWQHQGSGDAQASATLIPQALSLLAQAKIGLHELDAIVFGAGPGSFTGLRTACSVAQGLAFGLGVPVLPVDTLMCVAEDARVRCGATRVQVVLDARMDQVYSAAYHWQGDHWLRQGDCALLAPDAVALSPGDLLAGNAEAVYGARLPGAAAQRIEAWPSAHALLRLAPALLRLGGAVAAHHAQPRYVRDKVAQTTDERNAAHAAPIRPQP
jgi:tRNA threonylcarbamoyladenosine biosynthesis protein TsaB